MCKEIIISEEKLNEVFKKMAKQLVGTVLKRIELFSGLEKENEDILKKSVKEILYEGNRILKNSIKLTSKPMVRFINNK